jgi:DNA-binding NarL/FixJ family response regulator
MPDCDLDRSATFWQPSKQPTIETNQPKIRVRNIGVSAREDYAVTEEGRVEQIVFITGHGDIPMGISAMKRGAVDFLPKPFTDAELMALAQKAGVAPFPGTWKVVRNIKLRKHDDCY